MAPLLAPILAQLVTLNLGDRTEERYVAATVVGAPAHYETDTRPLVGLNFGFRRATLALTYAPSFTLVPDDTGRNELIVFHTLSLTGSYRLRHTTISAYDSLGYGERNLGAEILAGARTNTTTPPAGTGTPGGPAPGGPAPGGPAPGGPAPGSGATQTQTPGAQVATLNQVVKLATFTAGVHVAQELSRDVNAGADVSYFMTGGADASARAFYPVFRGPRLALTVADRFARHDEVSANYTFQYGSSPGGPRIWTMQVLLAEAHIFTARTGVRGGVGLALSKDMEPNGLIGYSLFPTFDVSAHHGLSLARGELSLAAGVVAQPVLDPVAVEVDTRLGPIASATWTRARFSAGVVGSWAVSLGSPTNQGGLSATFASARVAYRLGQAVTVDTGVRGAWQRFQGELVLPFTWAVFVGLTIGLPIPLNGR